NILSFRHELSQDLSHFWLVSAKVFRHLSPFTSLSTKTSMMTIQELTAQLASDPSHWESRLALVQAFVADGRHDSAVEVVIQAEAFPHDAGAWLAAARTYAAVGAIEQARGLVASALEIDPDYAPAKAYQSQLEAALAPAPVSLSADDLDEE